jgi:hypothetical protein
LWYLCKFHSLSPIFFLATVFKPSEFDGRPFLLLLCSFQQCFVVVLEQICEPRDFAENAGAGGDAELGHQGPMLDFEELEQKER